MSDQCRHCACRGSMKQCEATDCSIRDSWYVQQLMALVRDLSSFAADHAYRLTPVPIPAKEVTDEALHLEGDA